MRPNPVIDCLYEEAKGRLFLRNDDATAKIDAYVAVKLESQANDQDRPAAATGLAAGAASPGITTVALTTNAARRQHGKQYTASKITLRDIGGAKEYFDGSRPLYALFLRKKNSLSELTITADFFEQLCEVASIPLAFRDYILYFGKRPYEVEIAPPPLNLERSRPAKVASSPIRTAMGVVRFMEQNGRVNVPTPSEQWSIRQTAYLFRRDSLRSRSIWLLVAPSKAVEAALDDVWASGQHEVDSPWETMYTLLDYAARNWRPYTVVLMHEIEQHESNLLGTSPDDSGPVPLPGAEERQALLILEKQVSTARLALQATKADVEFVLEQLHETRLDKLDETTLESLQAWTRDFKSIKRHLEVNLMRFDDIHTRLHNLTTLLSNFLDLHGSYALQMLTQESKRENETMRRLNERMADLAEKNAEESVTVTVLAILTTIYLPFTVVSNFFSTSFVGTSATTNRIFVTQDSWILFIISLPLTALTIYIWRAWSQFKVNHRYPFWWSMLGLKQKRPPPKLHQVDLYGTYDGHTPGSLANSP